MKAFIKRNRERLLKIFTIITVAAVTFVYLKVETAYGRSIEQLTSKKIYDVTDKYIVIKNEKDKEVKLKLHHTNKIKFTRGAHYIILIHDKGVIFYDPYVVDAYKVKDTEVFEK